MFFFEAAKIKLIALILLFWLPIASHAADQYTRDESVPALMYVSDDLTIVMRSGKSRDYKIIRYLTSGTPLEVLGQSEDNTWYLIRTKEKEGWVEAKDISSEPGAKEKLALTQTKLTRTEVAAEKKSFKVQQLETQLADMKKKYASLEANHSSLKNEHESLKKISGNAVKLNSENQLLQNEANKLRANLEELQTINDVVTNDRVNEGIYRGMLAVGLGVFIALLCQQITRRQRRDAWN